MPALPDVPGVLKTRFGFTLQDGRAAYVIWHFTYSGGPPSDADCVTLAGDFYATFAAAMAGVLWSGNYIASVDLTDLTSATSSSGSHVQATVGTYGTKPLSAATSVLASMPIARRYRGGKPRSYWPLLAADALTTDATWDATELATVQSEVLALQSGCIGRSSGSTVIAEHVSISYYEGFTTVLNPVTGRTRDVPKLRTGAIPVDQITSISCSPKPATQRRRLGKR